jgi:hypothetical protein
MRSASVLVALCGGLLASAALAKEDDCNVPMINWQTRAAVQQRAEAQGWAVRRIKTDDGCYEVYGRDAEGRAIEAKIDPGSLAIVEIEYEGEHDEDHEDNRKDKKRSDDHDDDD